MARVANDARRGVGARGEQLAEAYLARAGYRVLERNFRTGAGELDLVAAGSGCLVFCEVRARIGAAGRTPRDPGGALESIGPRKQRRLRRMAREWLSARGTGAAGVTANEDGLRFDAIGVILAADGRLLALEHVEDAF